MNSINNINYDINSLIELNFTIRFSIHYDCY